MNRWSTDALKRAVFTLIGLVVGLLDYLPADQPDLLESFYKAFAVTALLFISELALEIRDSQIRDKEISNQFIRRNNNITGALLAQINNELDRAVKVQDNQFIVDHETLAILSYDTFWKLLVERVDPSRPLTVQTIHSCAIDVWVDHPLTASLLNRQREFCLKGGKITRLICDRASEAPGQILDSAKKMADAGISVSYYNLASQRILDHNFAWDFARINETGESAIWDSFIPGGVIGEAIYLNHSQYKGKDLKVLWDRVSLASTLLFNGKQPKDERLTQGVPK
ncbi:MAG TPA: hypothetical protein VKK31_18690 [Thermoanaerobaculia bacterium]|nr:hypothetical protein [Thermoanaerobaculia bacterium]